MTTHYLYYIHNNLPILLYYKYNTTTIRCQCQKKATLFIELFYLTRFMGHILTYYLVPSNLLIRLKHIGIFTFFLNLNLGQ